MHSLGCVDFVGPDFKPTSGLARVHPPDKVSRPDERAILREVAIFKHVHYVFFRRFADDRSSQVAAVVVDNSQGDLSEVDIARLHHQLWLNGVAPLIYVAWQTRVDVLSCARTPDFWRGQSATYSPAAQIEADLANQVHTAAQVSNELQAIRARFSAWRLADGTFWEDPQNARLANDNQAAHKTLIQAIVDTDTDLEGRTDPTARRLLLLTVLIKYLEDRKVFPPDWFGDFLPGANSFFDVLRGGSPLALSQLLKALEAKFEGDVFQLPGNGHSLTPESIVRFARLVEGRTIGGQLHLWKLFSFEHIPVEVISRLYQRFVEGGKGVVYTPPFVAALLLDHALPYDSIKGHECVLDPACGSGIFLVGAFKRLVTHWMSQNDWQRPPVHVLKGILKKSIYGIEMESGAVDLAAFSLALAVCDALQPNVIWTDLRFDKLRGCNLLGGDYFELTQQRGSLRYIDTDSSSDGLPPTWPAQFDAFVGNPPFISALTRAGIQLERTRRRSRGKLPDDQAAFLFLEDGLSTLAPEGRLSIVQPSALLYNSGPSDFRKWLFGENTVTTVLDFTSIRGLYDGADTKTVAIVASARPPAADGKVAHLTFRRTYSTYRQIGFELDHYDRHIVPQFAATHHRFVWRANLLGGGRLVEVSRRLTELRTLGEFVDKQPGWSHGEGFIAGKGDSGKLAPYLTGKQALRTEALTIRGCDLTDTKTITNTHFEAPRSEERFTAPLLLIKEADSLPMAFVEEGFLPYRHKIIGIHAPAEDCGALKALYELLADRHEFYRFACALNGTQGLVGKATSVLSQDIFALPFPEEGQDLQLSFWENILQDDLLTYMIDFVKLGQDSELLGRAATDEEVAAHAALFCKLLGSIYRNFRACAPVRLNGLICQPFAFGKCDAAARLTGDGLAADLKELVYEQSGEVLRTNRTVRLYWENVLFSIKPDRLRYWIRSTAIRDADETLVDLRAQGY